MYFIFNWMLINLKRPDRPGNPPLVSRAIVNPGWGLVTLKDGAVASVSGWTDVLAAGGRADAFYIAMDLVISSPAQQQALEHDRGIHA